MPYIPQAEDPNAQGAQPGGQAMNQPPQTSSGGAAGGVPGASPQGTTAVPNATKAPPVQDLKAYLAANAPQAVQMGNNIAGNINAQVGQVAGDVNAAANEVNAGVQSQDVTPNSALVGAAAANPTEFVQDPNSVAAFLGQENANYSGPASFEATPQNQNLTNEVQNEIQKVGDITKPEGVQQLVSGQEQNPTTGMENLDTLLLQENPEALAPIAATLPGVQGLQKQLTGAQSTEDAAIQKAIADDAAAKAGVQSEFLTGPNAVAPAFAGKVGQEMTADQAQAKAYNDAIESLINQENTNPELAALTSDIGNLPVTMQPLPAAPSTINLPNVGQAATPQDIQTQQALETLLGSNYTPAFSSSTTPFTPPGVAPTFQSQVDPVIANLVSQVGQENASNPEVAKTEAAINALQKYLGEQQTSWNAGSPVKGNPGAPVHVVPGPNTPNGRVTIVPNNPSAPAPTPTTPPQYNVGTGTPANPNSGAPPAWVQVGNQWVNTQTGQVSDTNPNA